MKTLLAFIAAAVALVVGLAAGAAPVAAASSVSVPTWTVGQAVAYGTHVDLTSLVQPSLSSYWAAANKSGAKVNALSFTGGIDVWVVDTVTGVSSTLYTLSEQSASGFKFSFNANLTASVPVPGTYPGTLLNGTCIPSSTFPMANRTVAVTVAFSALSNGTSASWYQVSNLATTKSVANTTLRAKGTLSGADVPEFAFNSTLCQESITYGAQNLELDVNTQSQVRTSYNPALTYLNFPMSDGSTWWANSTATLGGTFTGTIDVTGLNSAQEQSFFQNLTRTLNSLPGIAVSGISGFPIDLAKITVTEGLNNVFQNGVLQDYAVHEAEPLRATAGVRTLGDQQQHNVYVISNASYACSASATGFPFTYNAIFAPDYPAANAGMIAGYEATFCLGGTNQTLFSLGSVPVSQGQANLQNTQTTYNPFPGASGNAFADFFLASPYLGLILIAVVVVAVAALIVVRGRRKRGSGAPPQTPPQTPPPPGTP